jgi:hypothetical protein
MMIYSIVITRRLTTAVEGKVVTVHVVLNEHHTMKAYRVLGEWSYSSTHSLTSALDGGEWSVSRPGRFTLRDRAPGIRPVWTRWYLTTAVSLTRVCIQKFPDWPPGARTANGTALCY